MDKKPITKNLGNILRDLEGKTLQESAKYLNNLILKFPQFDKLILEYDSYDDALYLQGYRLETDKEYFDRTKIEMIGKQRKIDDLRRKAKELGFELNPIYC